MHQLLEMSSDRAYKRLFLGYPTSLKCVFQISAYLLIVGLLLLGASSCRSRQASSPHVVVVYTSVDQVYAEPILQAYEQRSGVSVQAIYDVEATKTVGLTNRLVAEKSRPRADVFWNNEFTNTLRLRAQGVIAAYHSPSAADIPANFRDADGYWTAIGARARVFIINTKLVKPADYPRTMQDLLNPRWPAHRIGIAFPLFGTMATQAAEIYASMGDVQARTFFQQVQKRGIRTFDGNSVVRDMVVSGQLAWGVTDSDDALAAIKRNAPVAIVAARDSTEKTMLIPSTVALIAGAPHQREGEQLINYLLSTAGENEMIQRGACQFSLRNALLTAPWLQGTLTPSRIPFTNIHAKLALVQRDLQTIFLR